MARIGICMYVREFRFYPGESQPTIPRLLFTARRDTTAWLYGRSISSIASAVYRSIIPVFTSSKVNSESNRIESERALSQLFGLMGVQANEIKIFGKRNGRASRGESSHSPKSIRSRVMKHACTSLFARLALFIRFIGT